MNEKPKTPDTDSATLKAVYRVLRDPLLKAPAARRKAIAVILEAWAEVYGPEEGNPTS